MTKRYRCCSCGNHCGVITIDDGIGPYEYEGQKGIHHNYIAVSDCCEATAVDPSTGKSIEAKPFDEDDAADVILQIYEGDKDWEDLA